MYPDVAEVIMKPSDTSMKNKPLDNDQRELLHDVKSLLIMTTKNSCFFAQAMPSLCHCYRCFTLKATTNTNYTNYIDSTLVFVYVLAYSKFMTKTSAHFAALTEGI